MRADWGKMAEDYLSQSGSLVLCVQLVDVRHAPTKLDIQLNEWLNFRAKPHIVVATKSDKLSRLQLQKQLRELEVVLPAAKIIAYSSESGMGREKVLSSISSAANAE